LNTLKRAICDNVPTGVYDDDEIKDIRAGGRGYSTGPVFLEATLMKRYLQKTLLSLDVKSYEGDIKKMQRQVRYYPQCLGSEDVADAKARERLSR
jgi:hypothetical protein